MAEPQSSGIPSKSPAYLHAQDLFYFHIYDVFFYVEDTDSEEFYYAILKKLFPAVRFDRVFPLGSKKNVVEAAKAATSEESRIYIVDKDFDDLLGRVCKLPNLFYLQRYSIENFLLEEDAVVTFIVGRNPRVHRRHVSEAIRFTPTYKQILGQLGELIPPFLVIQNREEDKPPTTSVPVERFVPARGRQPLSRDAISRYISEILLAIVSSSNDSSTIQAELADWRAQIDLTNLGVLETHVPGKLICKAMLKWLERKCFYVHNTTLDQFCFALATNASLESLAPLRSAISRYLNRKRKGK